MPKIAIVTDSTTYLPKELVAQYSIIVLPQIVIWDGETYEDGVDIQSDEFYVRLKTSKSIPTTSQVSIANMHTTFSRLLAEGYDVLGIFISEKLSGTMQSAVSARNDLVSGKERVHLINSETAVMALGFQVLTVARAVAKGANIQECVKLAESLPARTGVFFAVETLEFLHKGGRIGGAQRFLGSALNLKPILTVQDGRVEPVERIRTKAKAHARLVELAVEHCQGKSPIRIAVQHASALEDAQAVMEKIKQSVEVTEFVISGISPAIGTHTGPGTIALVFMTGI